MILLFLIPLALLLIEGWFAAQLIVPRAGKWLQLPLALPVASLSNALLTFAYTVVDIPLVPASVLGGHVLIIIVLFVLKRRQSADVLLQENGEKSVPLFPQRWSRFILLLCYILLGVSFVYSFVHAVLLPTMQLDSLSNWTHRAQVSFVDHHIVYDATEDRGVAKPQYPILLHSLQITANQLQFKWNDHIANTIHWLLSLSSFGALFLIIRRLRGKQVALLGTTLILSIPLLQLHLAQGFGDLPLAQYLLLALGAYAMYVQYAGARWLMLSAFFVGAACWTKSEGLFIGFFPFVLMLGCHWFLHRPERKNLLMAAGISLALAVIYPLFLVAKGMHITPHSTDTAVQFTLAGFPYLFPALFTNGSLGITWYVLPAAIVILLALASRRDPRVACDMLPTFIFGTVGLAIVLFTYLFTENVQFLINEESFFRQLYIPAALLILSCILAYTPAEQSPEQGHL